LDENFPQTIEDKEVDRARVQIQPTLLKVQLGIAGAHQGSSDGLGVLRVELKKPTEVDERGHLPGGGVVATEVGDHLKALSNKEGTVIKPALWL
jgi:hypothetical protein